MLGCFTRRRMDTSLWIMCSWTIERSQRTTMLVMQRTLSPNSCEHEHADLSPAFILADDLQSIFSPCGSLHTLSDDGKVSVPQSPPNFVPLCYGDGDGGVLIHQLRCGVTRDKIGKVKIETRPKIVIRSYLHCRDHRPHPWSCKPLWRLKKVKNHYAGIPEGKKEL